MVKQFIFFLFKPHDVTFKPAINNLHFRFILSYNKLANIHVTVFSIFFVSNSMVKIIKKNSAEYNQKIDIDLCFARDLCNYNMKTTF